MTMTRFCLRCLLPVLILFVIAAPAGAATGGWVDADVVRARVVAAIDAEGNPVAAVEIQLEPGWKAYWRTPGEGGLPTLFDFSQSLNLAFARPHYPAPRRYNDGYGTTNVYEGRVLFPIDIEPALATAPMTIVVGIDMGVCESICIPLQVEAFARLDPGELDAGALAIVDEAYSLLPGAPVPGAFEVTDVDVVADTSTLTEYEVTVLVPQAFGAELFVEGPDGWYPTAPQQIARDGNRLTFAFAFERPVGIERPATTELVFTLVSQGNAIEQAVTLR